MWLILAHLVRCRYAFYRRYHSAIPGRPEHHVGLSGCATWGNGCGIFTSVTGTAPNRQFHIEWHAVQFADNTQTLDGEIRFTEGVSSSFIITYNSMSENGIGRRKRRAGQLHRPGNDLLVPPAGDR